MSDVEVILKHKGKWFKVSNITLLQRDIKCPFCKETLEENFDYEIVKFSTESPSGLPKSLKEALEDSYGLWVCPKCGKIFAEWEIGDYDSHLFYEVKTLKVLN